MLKNILVHLWEVIQAIFVPEELPVEAPIIAQDAPKTQPTITPTFDLLDVMAQGIKSREGWFPPCPQYPSGTTAWKNNNPGNLKYAGQPEAIGKDLKGFAIFPNEAAGMRALKNQILLVARGQSIAYPKKCTILQFFQTYAPAVDNNDPLSYCDEVRARMKVKRDWLLSNLLTA